MAQYSGFDDLAFDDASTEAKRDATSAVPLQNGIRAAAWRIEDLPKPALCVPLVAQYLWLAARYRSLTLPTAVNPSIETGGMVGESKAACLAQIGTAFAGHVAPWVLVGPGANPCAARQRAGLDFPLIAKPDIGWCGYGVRIVRDDAALEDYAASFPPDGAFIVQALAEGPHEAGLFYVRDPDRRTGRLTAITLRHTPFVTGDGHHNVAALVDIDARQRGHAAYYAAAMGAAKWAGIPAPGERVLLTTIASLRAGARYEDASAHTAPALATRIDAIARSMDRFHWGRFDVRFNSLSALQAGEFTIIEVNGAGAEAINFWDSGISLRDAFAGVFAKQSALFALGARMRARGCRPVGVLVLARAWLKQMRLVRRYPLSN
jgi:hypothetical protein